MLFAEGVPNAAAAHLSLMLSITGACQTVIGSRTAGLDALRLAAVRIAAAQWERAIVSAGEEYCDMVNAAYRHCGHYASQDSAAAFEGDTGFAAGAGAITLVLESREAMKQRGGLALGRVVACAASRSLDGSFAEAAHHVLEELGPVAQLFSSANATVLDRAESAAARKFCPDASITSLYGRFPETFSVMPLTALAAGLLAPSPQQSREFAILCTDYHGLAAGARLARVTGGGT
jgi:3-oxoacyl-[acyl-carrier-protein] synthase II